MEVPAAPQVHDEVGERIQKLFQDFLEEWNDEAGENEAPKYLAAAKELVKPEHNTLSVSMKGCGQVQPQPGPDDLRPVLQALSVSLRCPDPLRA